MKQITILALLLGGLVAFTAVLSIMGSGMPLNDVKTTLSSSDSGNISTTNTTSDNPTNSIPAPSGNVTHDGWSDGHWSDRGSGQWALCP
jgi:hypothetical protein